MKFLYPFIFLIVITIFYGCKKDFLDAKPGTNMVSPNTLADEQALLENINCLNRTTPGLLQMSSDDYNFVDYESWLGTYFNAERNSYIWAKDLYEGQLGIKDWNVGYSSIFTCNNVLEGLNQIPIVDLNRGQWNNIKGWALFMRAYAFYDLVRSFSPAYDSQTATTDLGIPIRLKPGIDEIEPRSSVEQTYNQILSDLSASSNLLYPGIQVNNKERPSKVATMALFSRIYLSMRKYDKAEQYADSTLNLYPTLIDYNTIDTLQAVPFSINSTETILNTTVVANYYNILLTADYNTAVTINPSLYQLYDANDLRRSIFFGTNIQTGLLYMKYGYAGAYPSPFTGLATDEVYLIKAECLARRNQITDAMSTMNTLLINRYKTGHFIPMSASNSQNALNQILVERRKELIWRSLRWTDLKRLNKEGADITLQRVANGITYTLPPNDPRYVFPIPDDEIALSGIQQNIR
ncbi:RagB/SusD family nutrient uptake outer membrane protein [Pedobacter sp. L105]|uniref:RagB/SusD family nutrient uptake outer membrane protein n=1 Tax=Pedobacter sp. L105 TaxID=1641871 RepID=UPI00131C75E5|nr:RagB/SusD family nutrient uptake outer membrane protein [Pedobacter sp. L105]